MRLLFRNQKIIKMKTKIAMALLFVGVASTQVGAQNKLKVNYNEYERQYVIIKDEVEIGDLNEMILDQLAPVQHWRKVETRINQNYQLEHTYEWDSTTYAKSYSEMPKKLVITPVNFSVFDAENTLLDTDSFEEAYIDGINELASAIADYGYHPGMPNFSRWSYEMLLEMASEGIAIDSSNANQIKLTMTDGRVVVYDYAHSYIHETFEDEFQRFENLKMFMYQEGVGFLPSRDISHSIDKELDSNVTFVVDRTFSDYVISDFAGILQSTNTIQNDHVRLYPVPIQEHLNVELINLPNDVIRGVTVRDFQGNAILNISGNDLPHQVLSTAGFPTGLIHIEVTTNGGVYTRQSFKN